MPAEHHIVERQPQQQLRPWHRNADQWPRRPRPQPLSLRCRHLLYSLSSPLTFPPPLSQSLLLSPSLFVSPSPVSSPKDVLPGHNRSAGGARSPKTTQIIPNARPAPPDAWQLCVFTPPVGLLQPRAAFSSRTSGSTDLVRAGSTGSECCFVAALSGLCLLLHSRGRSLPFMTCRWKPQQHGRSVCRRPAHHPTGHHHEHRAGRLAS